MTPQRWMLAIAAFVLFSLLPSSVQADVVSVAGAQLTTPDDGWGVQQRGEATILLREKGAARLEVVRIARVPAADPKAIAELLPKNVAEAKLTTAAALEQHGAKGVRAEGTAKDGEDVVRVRVVALPVGDGAVMVTALVGQKEEDPLQKEVEGILSSFRPQPPGAETADEPTAEQFVLKVENLVDNVADLDARRFTIIVATGKPVSFLVGGKGVRSYGHRTKSDAGNVRRLEAIVVLRLHGDGADAKIRRLMKFHRTKGSSVENELGAAGRESLAGAVDIKVKSGRYPVGTPLVVGTLNGEELVVNAE
jgi:hypothetical protein